MVEGRRPDEREPTAAREDASLPLISVVDARVPGVARASVADLLAGQAGVRVRSRGGLGAFTSISLRGSEEGEVTVLLDGVPLSRAASGAIDLAQLPADGLERVEIYRGAPPIELGGEAVGGVINLVSRRAGRRLSFAAELGAGSFGARAISAHVGGAVAERPSTAETLTAHASASYRGAEGDFTYFDSAGTPFFAGDDRFTRRRNNDFDQGNADVTLDRRGRRPLHLGVHGFWKSQGVPGVATLGRETEHARLTTSRLLVTGTAGYRRRVDAQVQTSLLFERNQFSNPLGEGAGPFGAAVTEGASLAAGLVPRVALPLGRLQLLTVVGEARLEHRRADDLLRPRLRPRPALRGLFAAAIADELQLWRDRLSLYAGLRLDLRASSLLESGDGVALPDQDRFDWFLSPRVSLRLRAHRLVTLRASAGRYVRFPTLLEQFGDGALVLGRPTLRPESSWGGDVAATVRGQLPRLEGSLEVAFFGRRTSALIVMVPGGNTVTPINIGEAEVLGLEARADARVLRHVELAASYTLLDARDRGAGSPSAGRRLPGRAPHALDVRVALAAGPLRLGYELDYLSAVPRDVLNLSALPARTLHALTASYRGRRFEVVLEVRNLADTRVVPLALGGSARAGETAPYALVDFYNFPLPGRAVYATARLVQ